MKINEIITESKKKLGDCFKAAGDNMMAGIPDLLLVHAVVTPVSGPLRNVRHLHAWNEIGDNVIDNSNGRDIVLPKEIYYALGGIDPNNKDDYKVYDARAAREHMINSGTYGPWEFDDSINEDWKKTLGTMGVAGALAMGIPGATKQDVLPQTTMSQPQRVSNSDVSILAQTIWAEARGEGTKGMLAVGNVIKNRAESNKPKLFGKGIRGVALKPKQFSCWNPGDPNRERIKKIMQFDKHIQSKKAPNGESFNEWYSKFKNSSYYNDYTKWVEAKRIAEKIVQGTAPDNTKGATYYHTTSVQPVWANKLDKIGKIGDHVFYELPDKLDEHVVDNINGLGSTPVNANVNYRGLRVLMRPSVFLKLAYPLTKDRSVDYIVQHMQQGGSLGSPFLYIDIPDEYFQGDFSKSASVDGHEGRNRMKAIMKLEGDEPVEVHIFPVGEIRARHLTSEILNKLNSGIWNQSKTQIVSGPLFSVLNRDKNS